jgi:hypothetical protein
VELLDDPYCLISGADCWLMAFESLNEATRLWIEGRKFTVARLLGDAYKGQAERYAGGAVATFRLAPQDYHRFHSPVDGTIGPMGHDVYLGRVLRCERTSRHPSIVFALSYTFDCSPKPSARLSTSTGKTSARSSPLTAPPLGASWPYLSVL